jgi:3',5'-cyclic AMP phosphodiesterase CpdA
VAERILPARYWPKLSPWLWTAVEEVAILGLSTVVPGAAFGELSAATLHLAEGLLSDRPFSQQLLVACHHPPVSVDHASMDEIGLRRGSQGLLDLARRHRATAILCGHAHMTSILFPHVGPPVICAPSVAHEVVYDDGDQAPLRYRRRRPRCLLHKVSASGIFSTELTFGGESHLVGRRGRLGQ